MTTQTTVFVIPTEGDNYTATLGEDSFHEVQKIIGGLVESFDLPNGQLCTVNEEGKNLHLPLNRRATVALRALGADDVFAGTVVISGPRPLGDNGYFTDVDVEAAEALFGPAS